MDDGGSGGDDAEGEENDVSSATDIEGSPEVVASWVGSPEVSTVCASQGAGVVGTKNFAPTAGFTDGAEGDWNEFVKDPPVPPPPPPPLLNVSTYLDLTPILARAEN